MSLVTVLEITKEAEKRPYKVTDRLRLARKGVMARSLQDLIRRAKDKLEYGDWCQVYLVLEEDGTEVDDEEYFQTLPDNTMFMLLFIQDIWSPVGPPYTLREMCFDEIQV